MRPDFPEFVAGGVLLAPFVSYAAAAFIILLLLRPVLRRLRFERAFSNPPVAMVALFVVILATLVVLF